MADRFTLPSGHADITVSGATLGVYELEHGVKQVGLVEDLPVMMLLSGYGPMDGFADRTAPLLRSGWETALDEDGVRVLPDSEPALRWALELLTRQRLSSPHVGQTYLSSHIAAKVAFDELRAAYQQVHPRHTIRSFATWHAISEADHRAVTEALARTEAQRSGTPWTQLLLSRLTQIRAFASADELERAVIGTVLVDAGDGLTLHASRMPDGRFLAVHAGKKLLALTCPAGQDLWDVQSMPRATAVARPRGQAVSAPIGQAGMRRLTAGQAAEWMAEHASGEPMTLRACRTNSVVAHRPALTEWGFTQLDPPARPVRYYTARTGKPGGYQLDTRAKREARARKLGVRGFTVMDDGDLMAAIARASLDRAGAPAEAGFAVPFKYKSLVELAALGPKCDDPAQFEALVASAVGGRFTHPDLAPLPARLSSQHPWRVLTQPLNPFTAPVPASAG